MAAAAAVEAEQRLGELWVGCAGYSYPHWRQGVFYPKGQKQENELRYYSSIFDTCEVNMTFYGTPSSDTVAQWQQQVKGNAAFRFTLKMRQIVTHGDTPMPGGSPGRGSGAAHERREGGHRLEPLSNGALEAEMPRFLERCEQLRTGNEGAFPPSLGVVLLQFPPSFEKSLEALERLARHLPGGGEAPAIAASAAPRGSISYALEFRHRSWYAPEIYALMRRQGWGLVQHALIHNLYPEKSIPEVDEITAPFVYLRLHGKKAEHAWDYSPQELQPYCNKVVAWRKRGLDCFVYLLNDADGMAPKNAFDLLKMVRAACGEPAPSRPEDAQRQMMANYFSAKPAAEGGVKRGAEEGQKAPPNPKRPKAEEEEGKVVGAKGGGAATSQQEGKEKGKKKEQDEGGKGSSSSASKQAQAAAAGTKPLTAFFSKKK